MVSALDYCIWKVSQDSISEVYIYMRAVLSGKYRAM